MFLSDFFGEVLSLFSPCVDGIQFYSSVHNGGVNVVLFDANKADCKSVKIVEIKSVRIALS